MKNLIVLITLIKCIYCLKNIIWINKRNEILIVYELETFDQILTTLSTNSSKTNKIMVTNYYEVEHHNFNGQKIRLLFHEEPGVIISYDGNKRVTGYLGETWTFLSDYANFKLDLLNAAERRTGVRLTLNTSYNGLLRYIELHNADVIASIRIFPEWNDIVDYLIPLYRDRNRLFTKVVYQDDLFWMIHLFAFDVCIALAVVLIAFCIYCEISSRLVYKKKNELVPNCIDNSLYYSGLMMQRSYHSFDYDKKERIVTFFLCLQSLLLLDYNSARLLTVMMQVKEYVPYQDLKEIAFDTNYVVLAEKDSVVHLSYEYMKSYKDYLHDLRYIMDRKRIKFVQSRQQLIRFICSSESPYVIFENEFFKSNIIPYGCNIKAYGISYYDTYVTSGIIKNFTHKRTIDLGLLTMFEKGILTAQKRRLLGLNKVYDNRNKRYQPISIEKINGMIIIYFFGILLSLVILLLENICYQCSRK